MTKDLSSAKQLQLQCGCGKAFDVLEWQVIDVAGRPDLEGHLLAGEAQASLCPACEIPHVRSQPLGLLLRCTAARVLVVVGEFDDDQDDEPSWYSTLGEQLSDEAVAVEFAPWNAVPFLLSRDLDADLAEPSAAREDVMARHGPEFAEGYSITLANVLLVLDEQLLSQLAATLATATDADMFRARLERTSAARMAALMAWLETQREAEPDEPRHTMVLQLLNEAEKDLVAAFEGHHRRMVELGSALGSTIEEHVNRLVSHRDSGRLAELLSEVPAALAAAGQIGDDEALAAVNELGAYGLLHRQGGDRAEDVDSAIACYELVLSFTSPGSEARASRLMNLASAVGQRVHGDVRRNLARAESLLREAIDIADPDDLQLRSMMLTNLAVFLTWPFPGEVVDRAIEARSLCEEALRHRSPDLDATDWAYTQTNLAVALERLADHGQLDLEEAQATYEQILEHEAAIKDRWIVSTTRLHLAKVLESLSQEPRDPEAGARMLDRASVLLRGAAEDEPQLILRGRMLYRLAQVDERRGFHQESLETLAMAVRLLEPSQAPDQSADAAFDLAWRQAERGDWQAAASSYSRGVEATEILIAAPLLRGDREDAIRRRAREHRWAAFALARVGRVEQAVLTLENGRTRELRRQLRVQDPQIERLEHLSPSLADRLRNASVALVSQSEDASISQGSELEDVIAEVRRLPGMAQFGTGVTLNDVADAASPTSPLVFINPTPHGTVVLSVDHEGGIDSEFWPLTSREVAFRLFFGVEPDTFDLDSAAAELLSSDGSSQLPTAASFVASAGGDNPERLKEALEAALPWLGEQVGTPLDDLLERLGATSAVIVACGPLAAAPLAAAGWQQGDPASCLLDRRCLTMAGSATSHLSARRRTEPARRNTRRFLALADPSNDLPAARGEAHAIAELFGDEAEVVEGPAATSAVLVHRAEGASHLHLACHARGGMLDYQEAGLLLADGYVPMADIPRVRLGNCRLVVASACQTAVLDISELNEEAISLGSTLLAAGAACAVASLWSVDDLATALLITRFYEQMLNDPEDDPAAALWNAQLWLRGLDEPTEREFVGAHGHLAEHFRRRAQARDLPGRRGSADDPSDARERRPYAHAEYWAAFITMGG